MFPEHWKKRTIFLKIITKYWPEILNEQNKIDVDQNFKKYKYDCSTFGLSSGLDLHSIKNRIKICETDHIYQEIDFATQIMQSNGSKKISLISPDKNFSELLTNRLKFENISYNLHIDGCQNSDELSEEFKNEVLTKFKNLDQSVLKKLLKELACFEKTDINSNSNVSIIGIKDIKYIIDSEIIICTSLNEDSWKTRENGAYWLHSSIRKKLNLPINNKKFIEDDFFSMFNNMSEIYLTRSKKISGQSTTKSSLLAKFEIRCKKEHINIESIVSKKMDIAKIVPPSSPNVLPEFFVLPSEINANRLEQLMKDPYSFYAKDVLGLTSNDIDQAKKDFSIAFKSLMRSYFEDKSKTKPWLDFIKDLDFFGYQKCNNIINWLDENPRQVDTSYNNILGKISWDNFFLDLYAYCDRIEICNGFSSIIRYQTSFNQFTKEIIYGADSSLMTTCLIASKGGFKEIKSPVKDIQIWSIAGTGDDPISIKTLEISQDLIDQFEKRLYETISGYRENSKTMIDLTCDKKLKNNRYKHFERNEK